MISVIDCGIGNLGSIVNMLRYLKIDSKVAKTPEDILQSKKIIFPGVGNWDNAIKRMHQEGIVDLLAYQVLEKKIPFMGICLGMQLLSNASEEGSLPGLGWIDGTVKKFRFEQPAITGKKFNVPHMGWNTIHVLKPALLTKNLPINSRFYFVHSYYFDCTNEENILMTSIYGDIFTCAVNKDNIWGVQFHPEKSHKFGMQLMRNFGEL